MRRIPALLVLLRFVLAPVLVAAALLEAAPWVFAVALVLGFLSDVFDGIIARRLGVATEALRRLASACDTCFYLGVLFAIGSGRMDALEPNFVLLGALIALELTRYLVDWLRFRREAAYHMWSAKLWGILLFVGSLAVLGFGGGPGWVTLAVGWGLVCDLEGLAASFILREWHADVPSVVHAWRLRKQAERSAGTGSAPR